MSLAYRVPTALWKRILSMAGIFPKFSGRPPCTCMVLGELDLQSTSSNDYLILHMSTPPIYVCHFVHHFPKTFERIRCFLVSLSEHTSFCRHMGSRARIALRGSSDDARCCRRIPDAARCFQMLPGATRCSQMLLYASK